MQTQSSNSQTDNIKPSNDLLLSTVISFTQWFLIHDKQTGSRRVRHRVSAVGVRGTRRHIQTMSVAKIYKQAGRSPSNGVELLGEEEVPRDANAPLAEGDYSPPNK